MSSSGDHRRRLGGKGTLILALVIVVGAGIWIWSGIPQTAGPPADSATPGSRIEVNDTSGARLSEEVAEAPQSTAREVVVPNEAEPLRKMLRAIARNDYRTLADLYAPGVRLRIQEEGWDAYAEEVSRIMMTQFGSLDPEAYAYSYRGDGDRGVVEVHRGGKRVGRMRVVRDGDRWLLDEM